MANLIGFVTSSKSTSSRVDSSRIETKACGWNSGVTVIGTHFKSKGVVTDKFDIYLNGGSHTENLLHIGSVGADGKFYPAEKLIELLEGMK